MNTEILKAAEFLKKGEIGAIPTETVYGLAGNALNEMAVLKIFEAKNRPFFDPLIVHIAAFNQIEKYVEELPAKAQILAQAFWPGPLTLLLKKKSNIPDLVTAGSDLVAIRIPNHPIPLELLKSIDFPLAAPSANLFGYVSPTEAKHVEQQLGEKISFVLDGGSCEIGLESTIVGFENDKMIVYRVGGISLEELQRIGGEFELNINQSSNPKAPGMLKSHYAPSKKVIFRNWGDYLSNISSENFGIIAFDSAYEFVPTENQRILSPKGDLNEAARNLFSALRSFENSNVKFILAEEFPNEGLGRAINDRLSRASAEL